MNHFGRIESISYLTDICRPPQSVERVRLPPISQQQPASSNPPAAASQPSQPAKPASQASQPGQPTLHPGIEASGLQASMAPNSYIGASNRFPQAGTGRHSPPQGAKPSGTHSTRGAAKHAINPSNIDDMANLPANHVGGVFRQPDQPATRQGRTRGSPPLPPSLNPQS